LCSQRKNLQIAIKIKNSIIKFFVLDGLPR
jgi:hypothetical protein